MEEWEKKLKDLEAEVDQDFAHRAKEQKEREERDRATREEAARQAAFREAKKPAPEAATSPLTALTTEATTTAVKAAAQQSLMTVGPRKAAVYGAAALFLVWLLMRNLGVILVGTGALGALYYFLVMRGSGSGSDDDVDEDGKDGKARRTDDDDD